MSGVISRPGQPAVSASLDQRTEFSDSEQRDDARTADDVPLDEDRFFETDLRCWVDRETQAGHPEALKAASKIRQAHVSKASFLDLSGLSIRTLPRCTGLMTHLQRVNLRGSHTRAGQPIVSDMSHHARFKKGQLVMIDAGDGTTFLQYLGH